MTCPGCGKPASGNFCQHCGAALGGRFCNQCGAKLKAGARFCNQCGAGAGKGAQKPKGEKRPGKEGAPGAAADRRTVVAEAVSGALPWWIAGVAMFGLILAVGWSMVGSAGPAEPAAGATGGTGGMDPNAPGVTDISQMSPREAADRLYNRVMSALAQGDTAGGMGFQPMAVQAFDIAEPLDLDGLFHKAMLQMLNDPEAALESAERMLEQEPNHILGLGLAAAGSLKTGDTATARAHYQRLLDAYDAEAARPLPEYQGHMPSLEEYRIVAGSFLSGG